MYILAIETSCDDTCVAIIDDKKNIMVNLVSSQTQLLKDYGGVVPELSAREHIKNMNLVYEQALKQANLTISDIDVIAVTNEPGLKGSLLMGKTFAKTLARLHNKKLMLINHMMGHVYANWYKQDFSFPLIGVIVSGGHTQIIKMTEHLSYQVLGQTLDDSIGESYDKVAKMLDLTYPGGPIIDKLAKHGEPVYPMCNIRTKGVDLSYSGLKTHVNQFIKKAGLENIDKANMAASFQTKAVEYLFSKVKKAMREENFKQIIICGGVSANSYVRAKVSELERINVTLPEMQMTTDNAAMIAFAALAQIQYQANGEHE